MKLNALLFLATLASFAEAAKVKGKVQCDSTNFQYIVNPDRLSFYGHQLALLDKHDKWHNHCTFASITTEEEYKMASDIYIGDNLGGLFIGMTRPRDDESGWYWLDGSGLKSDDVLPWHPSQPDNDESLGGGLEIAGEIWKTGDGFVGVQDRSPFRTFGAVYECCIPDPATTSKVFDTEI